MNHHTVSAALIGFLAGVLVATASCSPVTPPATVIEAR